MAIAIARTRPVRAFLVTVAAFVASLGVSVAHAQSGCSGDTNGDGVVNGVDLSAVLSQWGTCPATISSVMPPHGSVLGGTVITITGTALAATSEVTVGGAPCTAVTVLSPTQVRATTPPGAAGAAQIAVTTPAGTSLAATPFTYVLQSVTSISPSSGLYTGGTAITITGQYLAGTSSVTIGGVPATSVVAVNSTTVTAVTPAGSVGAANVVVTSPKGTVTVAGGFSYLEVQTPSWATMLEAIPDPAVVTDASLRAAIIATGWAWRVRDNGTGIEMMLIPPGTFNMGCSASNTYGCNGDESPVHAVTLTNAFYMGRYEVTQAQWTAKMGSNPSGFQSASAEVPAAQVPNRPVERVSWNTIQGFLAATGMRLPTEAEWEYAYRAGTTTAFHGFMGYLNGTNDDTLVGSIAWGRFNQTLNGQTRPVGGKAANGYGLYDMSGNVWEWVNDWYGYYSSAAQTNPTGPTLGSQRVTRGGGWDDYADIVRSSWRSALTPDTTGIILGFRVARAPL
ncbi:MAG: hypothetical protein RLY21_2707 [Planctomycetota bacterium]|jgi:formylglycine-generating enzyme required for sulfatase activity